MLNILNYKEQVVDVKLLDMGDKWKNLLHMTLGHTSEISDELMRALGNPGGDMTRIIEEIGDAQFFLIGTMKFLGLWQEKYYKDFVDSDIQLLDLGFSWQEVPENFDSDFHLKNIVNYIQIWNGRINTIIKNILIKDTPKYEGKVLTEQEIVDAFMRQQVNINTLSHFFGYHIYQTRTINSEKLGVRYKAGFTTEESLNRDTQKEDAKMNEVISKDHE